MRLEHPLFFSRTLIIGLDVWDVSFWNILCVVGILLNASYLLYRVSAIICRELGDRWGEEEHAEFLHMSKVYQPFVDATDRESMWVSLPKPTYLHYVNPFGPRLCFCYKPSSLRNWYFYPYFLPHINSTLPRLFRSFIHCLKTAEKTRFANHAATVSHEVYNNEHGIQIHFPLALFKKLKGSNDFDRENWSCSTNRSCEDCNIYDNNRCVIICF